MSLPPTNWTVPCICGGKDPCPKHPEKPSEGLFSEAELAPGSLAALGAAVRRLVSWVRENRSDDAELLRAVRALEETAKRVGAST